MVFHPSFNVLDVVFLMRCSRNHSFKLWCR